MQVFEGLITAYSEVKRINRGCITRYTIKLPLRDHDDYINMVTCMCVVCVFFFPFIWTSSSLDVPAGVTQEEGHTGFFIHLPSAVRALIFLARSVLT